ncbi:MAG: hypothetical protein PHT78_06665 [Desulfitobacteriaceae bacterium]|nr:hypothetical protein [Desulfitobacteriaceae bacterium]
MDKNWIDLIQDYKSSGLTAAKWCEEKGFKVHILRYHINKLNKEKKKASNETQWASVVPANLTVDEPVAKPLKVIIGQSTIEVNSGFDPDTLKAVVKVLCE